MDERSRNVADCLRRISRRPRAESLGASVAERQDFTALAESPEEARHVAEGLAAVERGDVPSEEQRAVLEAIVLPAQRPVIDIQDDTFDEFPPSWTQLERFKPTLDRLIPTYRAASRLISGYSSRTQSSQIPCVSWASE